MRRVAWLGVGLVLLAGCASLTVPRGPVWVFDAEYSHTGRQIVYTRDERTCSSTREQFLRTAAQLLAPGAQPSATGTCRPARVFDDAQAARAAGFTVGASAPVWALRLDATGGVASPTQALCRTHASLLGRSGNACTPVVILPMEPPPAEAPK